VSAGLCFLFMPIFGWGESDRQAVTIPRRRGQESFHPILRGLVHPARMGTPARDTYVENWPPRPGSFVAKNPVRDFCRLPPLRPPNTSPGRQLQRAVFCRPTPV